MSRGDWENIKQRKSFYVHSLRKLKTAIVFFQMINIFLCVGISYLYWSKPKQVFYATNGETQPIRLTPMDTPNNSDQALLAPDPVETNESKALPD